MQKHVKIVHENVGGGGGAVYGLGFVGALIYYMQTASNFSEVLWGIVKSILWPAFLIYNILSSNPF